MSVLLQRFSLFYVHHSFYFELTKVDEVIKTSYVWYLSVSVKYMLSFLVMPDKDNVIFKCNQY